MRNRIDITLYEVMPGKYNCWIGAGHYLWECSFEEALPKVTEQLKIINGNRSRQKAQRADR